MSPLLLAELEEVLGRPKLAALLDPDALAGVREVLARAPAVGDPEAVAVSRDPKDDYLVALARASGADFLVSGDKDLTALREILPPVRTPAALLEALATDSEG